MHSARKVTYTRALLFIGKSELYFKLKFSSFATFLFIFVEIADAYTEYYIF